MVEMMGLHPVHKLTHVLHLFSLHDVLIERQGLHFPFIARARNHKSNLPVSILGNKKHSSLFVEHFCNLFGDSSNAEIAYLSFNLDFFGCHSVVPI